MHKGQSKSRGPSAATQLDTLYCQDSKLLDLVGIQ